MQERILWLYDGDHTTHPFIRQASESLVNHGYLLTLVDQARRSRRYGYAHVALRGSWAKSLFAARRRSVVKWIKGWWNLLRFLKPAFASCWDVIIVTLPTAGLIGWLTASLRGSRLVYYPFELFGDQHYQASPFWRKVELFLLQRGIDAIITQNVERARVYVEERKARVAPVVVHNYKRRMIGQSSGKLRQVVGAGADTRIVLYEGHLIAGRCLEELVKAVDLFPSDTRLVVLGWHTNWWDEHVSPLLDEGGRRVKVIVIPAVPHDELPQYVADADVGVVLYDDKVRNNILCAPGKLGDFILSGVPVIVPDFPTVAPLVKKLGVGEVCRTLTAEGIGEAIGRVLARSKSDWTTGIEPAQDELVWETQEPVFLAAIRGETDEERG